MPRRLKVLLSAYACEPGKGSEPEVGWQWALHMARFHDVTVLTRANNQPPIAREVERLTGCQPLPRFEFYDCGRLLLGLKRRVLGIKGYYWFWQRTVRRVIAEMHRQHRFDLLHHVTFAGFRYPTAIWRHHVATVWGPVGGIESIPAPLLPWHHPPSLGRELFRDFNNFWQSVPFYVLEHRGRATTVVLASTHDMRYTFQRFGINCLIMPTIGLSPDELPPNLPRAPRSGPLRLLFVGQLITLKGVDLALEALRASGTAATLDFYGTGNYLRAAQRLTQHLGLQSRVTFHGRRPREEILTVYQQFDAFLFPSLHDTGGFALIEAMANELPVICLDCGGPAIAVAEGCGQKIPLGTRRQVIAGLAEAIQRYEHDEPLRLAHGRAARQTILDRYDWNRKAEQMNEVYQMAVEKFAREQGVA